MADESVDPVGKSLAALFDLGSVDKQPAEKEIIRALKNLG